MTRPRFIRLSIFNDVSETSEHPDFDPLEEMNVLIERSDSLRAEAQKLVLEAEEIDALVNEILTDVEESGSPDSAAENGTEAP